MDKLRPSILVFCHYGGCFPWFLGGQDEAVPRFEDLIFVENFNCFVGVGKKENFHCFHMISS